MRTNWFFYFIKRALLQRTGRFLLSLTAVALLSTVLTAYLHITLGIKETLGKELRSFGANMIVLPQKGKFISFETIERLRNLEHVRALEPQVYGTILIQGLPVNIMGVSIDRFVVGKLKGRLPAALYEVIVGTTISEALSIEPGSEIEISKGRKLRVTGIFERGTEEDMAVVGSVETVQEVLGVKGYSAVLINAEPSAIEGVRKRVSRDLSLKTKTILQIAKAEESLYEKVKLLMLIVMAVVCVCVAGSLSSTMGANILERMEEIGLMKAIGARRFQIDLYFLAEAFLAGLFGSVAGFLLGFVAAELVTKTAFGSFVPLNLIVFLPVLFLSVLVAIASTALPVRKATGVPASWILRGE